MTESGCRTESCMRGPAPARQAVRAGGAATRMRMQRSDSGSEAKRRRTSSIPSLTSSCILGVRTSFSFCGLACQPELAQPQSSTRWNTAHQHGAVSGAARSGHGSRQPAEARAAEQSAWSGRAPMWGFFPAAGGSARACGSSRAARASICLLKKRLKRQGVAARCSREAQRPSNALQRRAIPSRFSRFSHF